MKRFNLDQFIWFLILMGLSCILTLMIISGKIFLLIDSGRVISTSIMMIILYALTIVQTTKVFTIPSRSGVKGGYIQFIALIFILIVISFTDIPKVSLEMKGVRLYHNEHLEDDGHTHSHGNLGETDTIYIKEEIFHEAVEELSAHIDKHMGKNIEIEGRYYDNSMENSFVITTLNMNCCIADSEYLGVMCDLKNKDDIKIKNGSKIKVTGIISSFEKDGHNLVKIEAENLIEVKE